MCTRRRVCTRRRGAALTDSRARRHVLRARAARARRSRAEWDIRHQPARRRAADARVPRRHRATRVGCISHADPESARWRATRRAIDASTRTQRRRIRHGSAGAKNRERDVHDETVERRVRGGDRARARRTGRTGRREFNARIHVPGTRRAAVQSILWRVR